MAKPKIIVMALDAAAVNSGVCIIEASPISKPPHVQYNLLYEAGLVHGPKNDHTERSKFADIVKGLALLHKVDFVVIEDYISRGGTTNTSSYEHGETVGQIKKGLWEINMPMVIVGPTQMRSFISVPSRLPDSGKQHIIDTCKNDYGFVSSGTNQNKRSNASDAFIHCIIGAMTYFHFVGSEQGELDKAKSDILLGDGKKMAGIVNSPQAFFNCDWATLKQER